MAAAIGSSARLKVVVIGATGATGRELVAQLLSIPTFEKVTTLGRRKLDLSEFSEITQAQEEESHHLDQHVIDFDTVSLENGADYFKGHDVFVTCYGTTRRAAGSAKEFKRIDFGHPLKCAEIAKECGIQHMVVMSSQGAKTNSWLPYLKSKGYLEQAFINLKFPMVSILRPGMLDRGKEERFLEKVAGFFVGKTHVQAVAKAICQIILKQHSNASGDDSPCHQIFEDAGVHKLSTDLDITLTKDKMGE